MYTYWKYIQMFASSPIKVFLSLHVLPVGILFGP